MRAATGAPRLAEPAAAAAAMTCAAILTSAPALAAPGGSGAAVPAGFKANSVTWLSARRGWVLGAAGCGTRTCADVIVTTDGATTWHLAGAVGVPIASLGGRPGVSEIRFATPAVGWAFGPDLFHTSSGGKSWAPVPIPRGGKQVLALATRATQAYAVVSNCAWDAPCPQPLSFWRIPTAATSAWTRIPLPLPPTSAAAGVAVSGATVYVLDAQPHTGRPDAFYASTDGIRFAARPAPCAHARDLALIQAVPMSATRVALLCDGNGGNPSPGDATKTVYTSADTGHTDIYAGQTGALGIQAELAASPRATWPWPRHPWARSSTSTTPTARPGPGSPPSATAEAARYGTTSSTSPTPRPGLSTARPIPPASASSGTPTTPAGTGPSPNHDSSPRSRPLGDPPGGGERRPGAPGCIYSPSAPPGSPA